MGGDGKRCAEIDAKKKPHTAAMAAMAAMAAKLQTEDGKAAY